MELLNQLKKFTMLNKNIYVLYGNQEALTLYKNSLDTLVQSDCMNFMVDTYSGDKRKLELLEDAFEVDGYYIIDEFSYQKLHINLCHKVKRFIVEPMRRRYLQTKRERNT